MFQLANRSLTSCGNSRKEITARFKYACTGTTRVRVVRCDSTTMNRVYDTVMGIASPFGRHGKHSRAHDDRERLSFALTNNRAKYFTEHIPFTRDFITKYSYQQ